MTVRVRFAPSPTGYLHVGGARTALFNWLWAKKNQGVFYVRIEDTDRTRYSEESLVNLIEELKWLGLNWVEGPEVGGKFGPYHQSERLDLYGKYAKQLVDEGKAYPCFCTSERLEALRAEQETTGQSGYDRKCRDLSPTEAEARMNAGEPYVIRFKAPLAGQIHVKDYLRGVITTQASELDDLVLLKTDSFPTYHLASVIDDHLMQTSQVLRGEEWIPSTPKHVLLYEAFGWTPPEFVHLPVILNSDGKGKLSKRKGAASVFDHRDMGILPEALFNFLALLGWNPGDDREIMSQEELIESFSLDRLSLKSAKWDPEKLAWMNAQYIAKSEPSRLLPFLKEQMHAKGLDSESYGDDWLSLIILQIRERCKTTLELFTQAEIFFTLPSAFDEKDLKKATKEGFVDRLATMKAAFESQEIWTTEALETLIQKLVEEGGGGFGAWGMPLRFALTRKLGGPHLPDILFLLGKDEVLKRLDMSFG